LCGLSLSQTIAAIRITITEIIYQVNEQTNDRQAQQRQRGK
jgi:hypothetical protein